MKLTKFLFACFLVLSCTKKEAEKKNVEITLLNKKITYSVDLDSIYKRQFISKEEEELGTNVIKLRFKNNTGKKLLFLIRDKSLFNIEGLRLNVYENGKYINVLEPLINIAFKNEKEREAYTHYGNYEIHFGSQDFHNDTKLGIPYNGSLARAYLTQAVVLHPDEYCIIKSIFPFPYIKEDNLFNSREPIYYDLKKDAKYTFSVTYKIDAKKLMSQLTAEQKKELKDNNIEIFDGEIETEKIPVVNLHK